MCIRFQHQKSEQAIGCTRLLDYDPGWGHEIGTDDFSRPFTALVIPNQIYDEFVLKTSNNTHTFESHLTTRRVDSSNRKANKTNAFSAV